LNIGYDLLTEAVREKAEETCSPERLEHISGVERLAKRLSVVHNSDPFKAALAALSHDLFRDADGDELMRKAVSYGIEPSDIERNFPILLHGKVAACFLNEEFGLQGDVFEAVYWHVSGIPGMCMLGKILMIADISEESRSFPEALQIRVAAEADLEKSFVDVIRLKITWAVKSGSLLLPETVWTWNELLGGANHVSN
jgi:predicted HD superfamily hydrolase involved in NAD metabolism